MPESAVITIAAPDRPVIPLGEVSLLAPKYTAPERFTGDFVSSRLRAKVNSLKLGEVCLDAGEFAMLLGDTEAGDKVWASFVDLTDILGQTRRRSRTQVKFGQLVLDSPSLGPKTALVAVKYTSDQLAAREFGAMTAFNASSLATDGNVTFTPLGFVRDPETRKAGLVSAFKMDAITSDTILWDRDRSDAQVAVALSRAAVSAAGLHTHNKAHGDLQPKNVAADNRGVWYTDLESAEELVDGRSRHTLRAERLITNDVRTFLTYRGQNSPVEMVEEFFARPYAELMGASDVPALIVPNLDDIMSISREPQQPRH